MQTRQRWFSTVISLTLLIPASVGISQQSDIPKVTSTYALTNATVIPKPGELLSNTTVLIENGLITAVGAKVSVPTHAKLIACDSMFIYAGFIEGLSHTGIPTPEGNQERPKIDDPGNPPNDLAGITPERQVKDFYAPGDKSVSEKRKLGFTASHVVLETGMLPGKGSLVLLGTGEADHQIVNEDVSMYFQLSPARRMYPGTVIGVMAKLREMYRNAEYGRANSDRYNENANGMSRPAYDRATEALFPVVDGALPLFFKAPNSLDVHKAFMLQDELGFKLVLGEVDEAWRVIDQLAESKTPVLLSVDLPEEPKEKKEEELEKMSAEQVALTARRDSSLKQHETQASLLADEGILFGFSFTEVKAKEIKDNVRRMIKNGLSPEAALAALTTTPAQMFGADKYMGTVEAGKMANLVVTTGKYFGEDSQVKYVLVEGDLHEYEIKEKSSKKKTGDENAAPAKIEGKWSFEVEVPGETQTGKIVFSGTDGDYEGELTPDDEDESNQLDDIEVSGTTLTFTSTIESDGQSLLLEFALDVTDDVFEGTVTAGPMGSFKIEGERIPNK